MTSPSDPRPADGTSYTRYIVRPDGNDLNSGGWCHWYDGSGSGVDRSDSSTPHVIFDGTEITGTRTGSTQLQIGGSVGYTVSNADTGNTVFLYFTSSDTWVQGVIYTVNTVTNTWNMAASTFSTISASDTVGEGRMGGSLATPGEASARLKSYNSVFVKTGTTYTLTTSSLSSDSYCGVSGGAWYSAYGGNMVCAYHTTPGDFHTDPNTRVIIDSGSTTSSGSTVPMVNGSSSYNNVFVGLELRGNDDWDYGGYFGHYAQCVAKDFGEIGFGFGKSHVSCTASGCTKGFQSTNASECLAIDCTDGYWVCTAIRSAASGCSNYGFYQWGNTTGPGLCYCAAHDCGTGFYGYDWKGLQVGCVATDCTLGTTYAMMHSGQAFYNCTTNEYTGAGANDRYQTKYGTQLTQNPFNDPDAGDFSLNDTAGGGAEIDDTMSNWAAGAVAGPQQQQSGQLKSTGGGSTTVVTPGPVQIGM